MATTKKAQSNTNQIINVLIVDDHPLVRDGIKTNISTCDKINVAGEADNAESARKMALELKPDVVIMDLKLPGISGVEGMRQILDDNPETSILVLTMYDDPHYVRESIRAGAKGYLMKQSAPTDLVQALEIVARGGAYVDPLASSSLTELSATSNDTPPSPGNLSKREREVLTMVAEGLSNKEVAAKLNLSVRTIETHRDRIMRKLNLRGTAQLTKYAISHGMVKVE